MSRAVRVAPLILAMSTVLAACPRRQEPATPPAPVVNQDSIARENARRDSIAAADRARAEEERQRLARENEERSARERAMAEVRNAITAVIYFDYDQATLSDQARATLDAKIPALNRNTGARILVIGHTDERGSDEYNLALGQRRAAAAKRYLVQRGVDGSRIETTSRGEEQPSMQGADESAYSQNRRAEFEITAGGDSLVPATE